MFEGNVQTFAELAEMKTDDYKTWFEGSKVVTDTGSPMIVYHGSDQNIIEFKPTSYGDAGEHHYFYFAKSKSWVKKFFKEETYGNPIIHEAVLSIKNPLDVRIILPGIEWESYFINLGIDIGDHLRQKLLRAGNMQIGAWQIFRFDTPELGGLREKLIEKGYDGLILNDVVRGSMDNTTFVAFFPEQIRLITGSEYKLTF